MPVLRVRLRAGSVPGALAGATSGQGLVEYSLILVLVAMVAIAGLIVLGPAVSAAFSGFAGSV